jgi:peptidyl-prolyl cis-trans isomerase B (cyclophilin B)
VATLLAVRSALVLALIALAISLAACGGGDSDSGGSSASNTSTESSVSEPGARGSNGCRDVELPKPKRDGGQKKPSVKLDPKKTYEVVMRTSCGSFTIRLAVKTSPDTTASFYALAKKGFFDDTVFHRIVPGFVIQGGDPTGRGTGGPGYSTVDRPPRSTAYTTGVVAMAKTGAEPPGTAGSQFYVVTGEDAALPPEYAILGKVTKGIEVTQQIGELGDPASGGAGTPIQPVVIEKATAHKR